MPDPSAKPYDRFDEDDEFDDLDELPLPPPRGVYAGFWMRFAAAIIDGVVLSMAMMMLSIAWTWVLINVPDLRFLARSGLAHFAVNVLLLWLWFPVPEATALQGSFGKVLLGIKVTDLRGRRISILRATGRNLGKLLSTATVGMGFAAAGFGAKKQALHDMMAETLVVVRRYDAPVEEAEDDDWP